MPDIADARALVLEDGRQFPTKVAGLFLFLPLLLDLDLPQAVTHAELPGSEQIPPLQALLALLVAKLLGKRRVSHISDLCCDESTGLFAGLNVLPKATYATDYSYKTERVMTERLIAAVIAKTPLGEPPLSFNLDFHAIPFRGTEPDLENHWVGVIAPVPGIMRLFWAFSSSNPPESPSQEESSLANMPDTLEARCRSDGPPAGPRSIDPLPGSRSFLTVSAVA